MDMDKAIETQLRNIEKRTGKTLAQLERFVRSSGLAKHGELRDLLKKELGMGHGDANTLVHVVLKSSGDAKAAAAASAGEDVVDAIYAGPKAALRPIHDKVIAAIAPFGPFDVAPKKTYLSLRRKKQFAMVGPATNTRVEVGLNLKGLPGTDRLLAQPPGGMCQFKVRLTGPSEVDAELLGWMRKAYDAAG
jgi:Domain of unknown function (DUF5655)/Domain of unknown function (DUF4287)